MIPVSSLLIVEMTSSSLLDLARSLHSAVSGYSAGQGKQR